MKCIVHHLKDGELPTLTKTEGSTAIVVGEGGENILAVTKPITVYSPLFEIKADNLHHIRLAIIERILAVREAAQANAPECNQMVLWCRTPLTKLDYPNLGRPSNADTEWFTLIGLCAASTPDPKGGETFSIEQADPTKPQTFGLN